MSKVVNIFDKKKELEANKSIDEKCAELKEKVKHGEHPSYNFEAEMQANKQKAERLKKEKEKANKSVIRSYRLKH